VAASMAWPITFVSSQHRATEAVVIEVVMLKYSTYLDYKKVCDQ